MAARHEDAPELAPANAPELAPVYPESYDHPPPAPQHQPNPYAVGAYAPKTEQPPVGSPATGDYSSAYSPSHAAAPNQRAGDKEDKEAAVAAERGMVVCGCSLLVFVLSVIIAILAAAVIGLAAGTGVEASRANEANNKLNSLQASVDAMGIFATKFTATATSTSPSASATSTTAIDNGCGSNPSNINGQTYNAFKLLGLSTFTMRCNRDLNASVVMSLFTSDFNTCMDSCSSYTKYTPGLFGQNDNTTCVGVAFIPLWTNKSIAAAGSAPGNCYLKKGPLSSNALITPNAGTPVHAAVLNS